MCHGSLNSASCMQLARKMLGMYMLLRKASSGDGMLIKVLRSAEKYRIKWVFCCFCSLVSSGIVISNQHTVCLYGDAYKNDHIFYVFVMIWAVRT